MSTTRRIAIAFAAFAGLAAAGVTVAADHPDQRDCQHGQRHAAAGHSERHEHGMQRMREMRERMHGEQKKQQPGEHNHPQG